MYSQSAETRSAGSMVRPVFISYSKRACPSSSLPLRMYSFSGDSGARPFLISHVAPQPIDHGAHICSIVWSEAPTIPRRHASHSIEPCFISTPSKETAGTGTYPSWRPYATQSRPLIWFPDAPSQGGPNRTGYQINPHFSQG